MAYLMPIHPWFSCIYCLFLLSQTLAVKNVVHVYTLAVTMLVKLLGVFGGPFCIHETDDVATLTYKSTCSVVYM